MKHRIYITDVGPVFSNSGLTLYRLVKEKEGYIFRSCKNKTFGHSGFYPSIQLALMWALGVRGTRMSTVKEIEEIEHSVK